MIDYFNPISSLSHSDLIKELETDFIFKYMDQLFLHLQTQHVDQKIAQSVTTQPFLRCYAWSNNIKYILFFIEQK
jgi:hypothetical protein